MKTRQYIIVLILLISTDIVAQNPILNAYKPGDGLTFTDVDEHYKMNIMGYAQPYFETKMYSSDSTNALNNRFRMRRLRLRWTGKSSEYKLDYRLQVDLSGTSEAGDRTSGFLMDAWIGYNPTKKIKIKIGQSADPTDNRELTMGSQTLQLVERSRLTSSFASIRAVGIFAQGTFRTGNGTYLKAFFTVNNGDGLNTYNPDFGGKKIGGRLDFLPFGLFTYYGQYRQADIVRELTPKLVVGGTYSKNFGMSSRRGRNSGAILYLNNSLEESLPDYTKYGVDFMFKYKGFSLLGEYMAGAAVVPDDITTRVRNNGTTSTSFLVDGGQDVEKYVKGRMMLGQAFNLQGGYVFKNLWSMDARYTKIVAADNSFLNNGTFYNRPLYLTFGLSKYFSKSYGAKVQASLTYVELASGSNDALGNPVDGNELIGRIITSFAF